MFAPELWFSLSLFPGPRVLPRGRFGEERKGVVDESQKVLVFERPVSSKLIHSSGTSTLLLPFASGTCVSSLTAPWFRSYPVLTLHSSERARVAPGDLAT